MTKKPNVNYYWEEVKKLYPDARFDIWFSWGELQFYPDGGAEERDDGVMALVQENGKFVVKGDF